MTALTGIFGQTTNDIYQALIDSTNVDHFCDSSAVFLFKAEAKRRGQDDFSGSLIILSLSRGFNRTTETLGRPQYFTTFPAYTLLFRKNLNTGNYTRDRDAVIDALNDIGKIMVDIESTGWVHEWRFQDNEYDPLQQIDSRAIEVLIDVLCIGEYNA